jgi:hypothetical protein
MVFVLAGAAGRNAPPAPRNPPWSLASAAVSSKEVNKENPAK